MPVPYTIQSKYKYKFKKKNETKPKKQNGFNVEISKRMK